jgi:hypothetical protein
MPFSQKPEEISFSDILDADEITSAASRMVRSFVRILTLLIVATLSFVVGVYVGPTKEGKELRASITATLTSLRSELHRKIEEVKTAPEEAARPTEPASDEPEPGPLALSPNKPSATPAPTMEGGKTVATPAETPLSPSGASDSMAVAPAAPPTEQTGAPPVTDTPRAAQAPVEPASKLKPQPKPTASNPKPPAPAAPRSKQTAAPPVTDTPRAAQAPVKPAAKPKPQPKPTAPNPKPAAPAAPRSEQTAAPPVTDRPRAAQAPVKPAPKPKPQPKPTAPNPKPAAPADAPVDAPSQ